MGLGSKLSQVAAALLVFGVLYFVYAPNFLTVKSVVVEGLSDSDKKVVEAAVRDSLGDAPFYNPQRNLLFLSKARVKEAVQTIASVDEVEAVSKNFSEKTLNITVKAKYERFLVRTSAQVFDVYNDGTLKGVAGLDRSGWETVHNPSMAKIDIPTGLTSSNSREFLTAAIVQYIVGLQEELKGITGSSLAYIGIPVPEQAKMPAGAADKALAKEETASGQEPGSNEAEVPVAEPIVADPVKLPINSSELNVFLQKGNDSKRTFRVIVDTAENPKDLVQRLNLLLSQTAQDRYNNLSYIDLRIPTRAFVCLLNTPCNK